MLIISLPVTLHIAVKSYMSNEVINSIYNSLLDDDPFELDFLIKSIKNLALKRHEADPAIEMQVVKETITNDDAILNIDLYVPDADQSFTTGVRLTRDDIELSIKANLRLFLNESLTDDMVQSVRDILIPENPNPRPWASSLEDCCAEMFKHTVIDCVSQSSANHCDLPEAARVGIVSGGITFDRSEPFNESEDVYRD